MGHGSASKTFTASLWFLCDWLHASHETALVITSDTVPSMERRIWADFKTLWTKSKCNLDGAGQVVDSKRMIRRDMIDGKNAIHAIAAESDGAQSKIQGIHTKNVRVIIDEADNPYSSSVWGAIPNLESSGSFKCVALANPCDKTSEFGQHCEPVDGWDSINPEIDFEWESKLGWHVLRLDGLQSPNILAGVDNYPFLLTNDGMNGTLIKNGTLSPQWWTYIRAWYPPEGLIKTIFPSGLLSKCEKKLLWYTTTTPIAACDPAFEGGDQCILTIGRMGRLAENLDRTGVEANEFIAIKRKDMTKPLSFDYAAQIIAILKDRGVKPENFAIDSTGNQSSFADIFRQEFGPEIMGVSFGGPATDRKVVNEDTVKASDKFKYFVTELWYVAREWCRLGLVQVVTPPKDLRFQLESRNYKMVGKLIQAESKVDMKGRGLGSPDYGDSFALLIHLARSRASGFVPGTFKDATQSSNSKRFTKNASVWSQDYGVSDNP